MTQIEQFYEDRLRYAFGHLVDSFSFGAYSAASGELADEVLAELGLTENEIKIVTILAEKVNRDNYTHELIARRDFADYGMDLR